MAKPPVPKVSIDFRIGKYTRRGDAKNEQISDNIYQAILNQNVERAIANRAVEVKKLQEELTAVVEQEYRRGLTWAVNNMIGSLSPASRQIGSYRTFGLLGRVERIKDVIPYRADRKASVRSILPPSGVLRWRSLQRRTVMDKGHRRYFENTGSLKTKLKAGINDIVRRTGIVKISTAVRRDMPKTDLFKARPVQFGDLTIRLIPQVPRALLPGLKANNFGAVDHNQGLERLLIDDQDVLQKLFGHKYAARQDTTFQRPLLQPVFTYWTQYYVPARIAQRMRRIFGST